MVKMNYINVKLYLNLKGCHFLKRSNKKIMTGENMFFGYSKYVLNGQRLK